MNGKNALVSTTDMDMSKEEIEEARVALTMGNVDDTVVSALRKSVENRKKQVSVLIDENKLVSSSLLAANLAELDSILLDKEVLEAVREGIIAAKDPAKSYNELAKASMEIYNRMMKQQLSSANPEAPQNLPKKGIKIGIFDSTGAVMVDIGGGE